MTGPNIPDFAIGLNQAFIPVNGLKATREALCAAQTTLGERARQGVDVDCVPHWIDRLQALCDQIDVHRPLGSDGSHGNRHTDTCGCEDR